MPQKWAESPQYLREFYGWRRWSARRITRRCGFSPQREPGKAREEGQSGLAAILN
jgi:hypothetical protein